MAIACPTCKLATWTGCGAHVEEVLGHIPLEQRCRCHEAGAPAPGNAPGTRG